MSPHEVPDPSGAPQPLTALLAEVKRALQHLEETRAAAEATAGSAPTEEIAAIRAAFFDARRNLADDAPEWLGSLVQAVEDQQRELAGLRADGQRLRDALGKIACHENAYRADCLEYATKHHGAHLPDCAIAVAALASPRNE